MKPAERLAEWIRGAKHAVAFTGAGISTESGIPDFRSPGGVWSRNQPVMYQDFLSDPAERRRYWRMRHEGYPAFRDARPNAGHRALARLETEGRLVAVITQNIDELHQRAGSRRVLELHGTAMRVRCLACDRRYDAEAVHARVGAGDESPTCDECGGLLKSMTISFGEILPADVLEESLRLAEASDLFMAVGSSLVVYPAAGLPELATRSGARLVIINREPTPLDGLASLNIREPIGETFERVMTCLYGE